MAWRAIQSLSGPLRSNACMPQLRSDCSAPACGANSCQTAGEVIAQSDVVVLGVNRAIHHHFVAIHNARTLHRVALHGEQEAGGAVAHQIVVEIETFFDVVRGRGWKARLHPVQDQPQRWRRRVERNPFLHI